MGRPVPGHGSRGMGGPVQGYGPRAWLVMWPDPALLRSTPVLRKQDVCMLCMARACRARHERRFCVMHAMQSMRTCGAPRSPQCAPCSPQRARAGMSNPRLFTPLMQIAGDAVPVMCLCQNVLHPRVRCCAGAPRLHGGVQAAQHAAHADPLDWQLAAWHRAACARALGRA